jgi:feruloyl-CoA synthase
MAQPQREPGTAESPYRKVKVGRFNYSFERRPDGAIIIKPDTDVGPYGTRFTDRLIHWADKTPDRLFMADRGRDGAWRKFSYAQFLTTVRDIGEALLSRNLSADRPVMILSGNDLEHALLGFAAMHVGIPYAPISTGYSLLSTDFAKLKHIVKLLTPGLVFAADGVAFARALETVVPADCEIVVAREPLTSRRCTPFSALTAAKATSRVDDAHATTGLDTIGKFLFTSGSTGHPKAVINTNKMMACNQVQLQQSMAYWADEPPTLLDWSPWNHTAGGNHDVGLVLHNGGSFYIDDGKPIPGGIEATVRNLHDVSCNWYFNVPKGYEALIPYFEKDKALRETFFKDLKVLWYAGAGISNYVLETYERMALETIGERILFLTSLGATETAPFAIARTWPTENAANIGLPGAGMTIKLAPSGDKLEARIKGPNVTPGYWREPALTAAAFDEEGYYKLGDALKFADPNDWNKGLLFDGRVTEDFKLATGTWVNVGGVRASMINQFAPYMKDGVITGTNRDDIGVLVFPEIDACRKLCADLPADADTAAVLAHPAVTAKFASLMAEFAKRATGSSNRVARIMLMTDLPSMDLGEATDKGSLNQRTLLTTRAALVEELYAAPRSPRVIALDTIR